MITQLHLRAGSSPGQPPLSIPTPPSVTIFVGPNNSGKSQLLREIHTACKEGNGTSNLVLDHLDFPAVDKATAEAELAAMTVAPRQGEATPEGHVYVKDYGITRRQMSVNHYILGRTDPKTHRGLHASLHTSIRTLSLDGATRATLLEPQSRGNLLEPTTPLARLYMDNVKRITLRQVVLDAIGLHIGLDAYTTDRIHIRFGRTAPPNERHHDDETTEWMSTARMTNQVSDGVKAFTGILVQVFAGNPKIIVVDEPEAFLHPSLAHKLGAELARSAAKEQKHVFVATHSAQFVMGAIQSGAHVNIIRLTFDGTAATARLLPNAELIALMNDPLLRSTGVLAGLFYEAVVVGEADTDRAFYDEINHRLIMASDDRAIGNALFLNAGEKQTVPRIVDPLRRLGITAVGIVDIDVVKDVGGEWTKHIRACQIPAGQENSLQSHRHSVYEAFKAATPSGADPKEYFKRNGGVALLPKSDRDSANSLFDELARHGYFIVRGGEVEHWLASLPVPRSKQSWRSAIFTAMGSDPDHADYVRPASGDVWDFIGSIKQWIGDPNRKGLPN